VRWVTRGAVQWPRQRLRYAVRIQGGATPDTARQEYWDGGIPWVSPKDMKRSRIDDSEDHVSAEALQDRRLSLIAPGAILIVVRGMILAHSFPVAIAATPLTINQDMKALRARETIDGRFLYWSLVGHERSFVALADESAHGTRKLDGEVLGNFDIGIPGMEDQRAIADFLDTQTAMIDTLLEKKRALIERLEEKRAALIIRSVTRGLPLGTNSAAGSEPFRSTPPSRAEWAEEIPGGWQVIQLRRLLMSIEQGWSPECSNVPASSDEWGVLKAGCCNGGRFHAAENKALPAELDPPAGLQVRPGDLLMSRASGSEQLIGATARVPAGFRERLLLSDKIYRIHLDATLVDADFLALVLQSHVGRQQIESAISGASGLAKNIAQSDVKSFLIPLPPMAQQRRIIQRLHRETTAIDALISKIHAAIARLEEYRAALVTAAVTGKIDVTRAPAAVEAAEPTEAANA
jgi:type I restriction enzyme, S subunit